MGAATTWRKSSYSGPQSDCVELASTLDRIRDSKNEVVLPVNRRAVAALISAVKDNHVATS